MGVFLFQTLNFAAPRLNIFRQNFLCVERLNLFVETSSAFGDWIYQKLFSSAGRWNISFSCVIRLNLLQKHLPGVERLHFHKKAWKTFMVWRDWIFHGLFSCGGKMENCIFVCWQIESFTETSSGRGEIDFSQKAFLVWRLKRFKHFFRVWRDWKFQKASWVWRDWNNVKPPGCETVPYFSFMGVRARYGRKCWFAPSTPKKKRWLWST